MTTSSKRMKLDAFFDGFKSFYTGQKKEISYTKNPDDITARAWLMTGESLRKAGVIYERRV